MNVRVFAITLLLAVAGCGGGEPMSDRDVGTIRSWSRNYTPIAADMLATSEALNSSQLDTAATALGRIKPKLDAADAQVQALQTPELRATLADFMRITRRTITAFDAFLAHLRTSPEDRRERIRVLEELREANQELFGADSKIRDRVFDHADEAQEKQLDQVIPLPAAG